MTPPGGRRGGTPALVACVPGPAQAASLALPPPRGLPRPRRTAGPVTLAPPPPPRSILGSRPPLASSSFLLLLPQRPAARARPGHARRLGDPTGSAGGRAPRRSGLGDAGAASAPFPEVSAPLPGELSPPPRRGWRAGFVSAARGAGCQGTGGHAFPLR